MELTLFTDHQCNLRCTYCYTGEKASRRMPLDVAEQALALVLDPPPPALRVALFGGEPMLHMPYVRELVALVQQRCAAARVPLSWTVNTNATRLDDEQADFLAELGAHVYVSLDGEQALHDAFRVYGAGQGSYDRVIEGIARLRSRRVPFELVAVVSPRGARRLARTVAELTSHGPRAVHLSIDYTAEWEESSLADLRSGYAAVADLLLERYRRGEVVAITSFDEKIVSHVAGSAKASRCAFGVKELAVAPSGNLYTCAQAVKEDRDTRYVIGNVEQGIDWGKVRALRAQKERVDEACSGCGLQDRCANQCGCRQMALSGELGVVTELLCETEEALVAAADRVAETLWAEQNPAFIQRFYQQRWRSAGDVSMERGQLVTLRRRADSVTAG